MTRIICDIDYNHIICYIECIMKSMKHSNNLLFAYLYFSLD